MAEGDRIRQAQSGRNGNGALQTPDRPKLRARSLPAQQGEVAIAVAALNTMIRTAKTASVRVA